MRILFVVPYVPNPIRVRPYQLIRHLGRLGHKVTVATLSANPVEAEQAVALAEFCERVVVRPISRSRSLLNCLRALPNSVPLQAAFAWQPALAQELGRLLDDQNGQPVFDVIHVEHLRGAPYGLYLQNLMAERGERIPIVWDSVDCISFLFEQAAAQSQTLFGRWATRLDLARTKKYEGWLIGRFDRVLVTSPDDKQALLSLAPVGALAPDIEVLPNGVDLAYFEPGAPEEREPSTIVASGKMSYHANVTMVRHLVQDIMPLVWTQRPEIKVSIVGKDPPREILSLAQSTRVAVTGTVPDIRPYLRQAAIAVAPLPYGAGIQNKVLEAMSCATPVIATSQAAAALTAVPGREMLLANDPAAFAHQILDLLSDPARQRTLGTSGRAYVEATHNWETIAMQLERVYVTLNS